MARLAPLGVAVLALLAERDLHPYEMYQLMLARQEDRVVKVTAGSLYRAIDRLADDGLIASLGTDRSGNRPERTTYSATPAGLEALRQTVAELLRQPVNEYPLFPLAIGEAHNLLVSEVVDLLGERLLELERLMGTLDAVMATVDERGVPRAYVLNVTYTRAMHAAEAAWIADTLAELADGRLPWPRVHGYDDPRPAAAASETL